MATLNGFILSPAACRSTARQREHIVAFPWQHWSREDAIMLRYAGVAYLVFLAWTDVWWWETPRHSVLRSSHEIRGEQILTSRKVKTCRLQKQSMIRHRKWVLEQLSVSWIVFMESFCNSICFICISVVTSGQDVRQRLSATHVAYCGVEPTNKRGSKYVWSILYKYGFFNTG